jgi:hypothetical protein
MYLNSHTNPMQEPKNGWRGGFVKTVSCKVGLSLIEFIVTEFPKGFTLERIERTLGNADLHIHFTCKSITELEGCLQVDAYYQECKKQLDGILSALR